MLREKILDASIPIAPPHPRKDKGKKRGKLSSWTHLSFLLTSCLTSEPHLPSWKMALLKPIDSGGYHWRDPWSTVASTLFSHVLSVHICSLPFLLPHPHFISEFIKLATEKDFLQINKNNYVQCRVYSWSNMTPCRTLGCRLADPLNVGPQGQKSKMHPPTTSWLVLWVGARD